MTAPLAPHRGVLRVLRGTWLAVTSASLAVFAHLIGGGSPPGGAATVLGTLAIAGAAIALADRRRGPVALMIAVGTSQLLMHTLLAALGGHAHMHPTVGDVHPAAMFTGHAAAALVTALLLAGAEDSMFALSAALRRALARGRELIGALLWWLTLPPLLPAVDSTTPGLSTAPPVASTVAHSAPRPRGPPTPPWH